MKKQKWTNEEIAILKREYSTNTNKELQEKYFPNRTIRSIECKANHTIDCDKKTKETLLRARLEVIDDNGVVRYSLSEKKRNKISNTKKEYFKTHDGWWKGRKRSQAQREKISKFRKENGCWAGKNNPRYINPLNGEKNGRWKGGILDTYLELRSETKIWQNNSLSFL